jgi:hypothetical protein
MTTLNMPKSFDYSSARQEGYSDEDIFKHLSSKRPNFNMEAALKEGYSLQEINQYLSGADNVSQNQRIRTPVETASRLIGQGAIGAIQGMAYPYDIAAMITRKGGRLTAPQEYRQNLFADIERLQEQKNAGIPLDKTDQELYDKTMDLIKNPHKMREHLPSSASYPHFDVGSLIESAGKQFGEDLRPQDAAELGFRWFGLIKGSNPEQMTKAITDPSMAKAIATKLFPTATQAARSASVAAGLTAAGALHFGPIGALATASIMDTLPSGMKGIALAARHPIVTAKKAMAEIATIPTKIAQNREKVQLQQELIQKFRDAGIQPDIGTITGSPLIQGVQNVLAQSPLVGTALEEYKTSLLNSITEKYREIADTLGEAKYANRIQVGEELADIGRTKDIAKGQLSSPQGFQFRLFQETLPYSQKELLHNISVEPFKTDVEAANTVKNEVLAVEKQKRDAFDKRFEKLRSKTRRITTNTQGKLAGQITQLLEDVKQTPLLGAVPEEAKFFRILSQLEKKLTGGEGTPNLGEISLDELIAAKQTLGKIPDWSVRGTKIEEQMKQLYGLINEAIVNTLKESDKTTKGFSLTQEYQTLNSEYSKFKDVFENELISDFFRRKGFEPNRVYSRSLDPDRIAALDKILSQSPSGQKTFNKLLRDYTQKILPNKFLDDRELANLESVLGKKHKKAFDRFVSNQERLKAVEELPKTIFDEMQGKRPEEQLRILDSVTNIRRLKNEMQTPAEQKLMNDLFRAKLDDLFFRSLEESLTEQIKSGKFKKVFDSKKNREILAEILPTEAYQRLKSLESRIFELQTTANKFFNASKTATNAKLLTMGSVLMADVGYLLMGNPWPLLSTAGSVLTARQVANLMGDPTFLRLVEESILKAKSPKAKLNEVAEKLVRYTERKGIETAKVTPFVQQQEKAKEKD